MTKQISFHVTEEERGLILDIIKRGNALLEPIGQKYDTMDALMDISATIANGCPLKLKEWLAADDSNFAHDLMGIWRHIDRTTGTLRDCFLPRFAC